MIVNRYFVHQSGFGYVSVSLETDPARPFVGANLHVLQNPNLAAGSPPIAGWNEVDETTYTDAVADEETARGTARAQAANDKRMARQGAYDEAIALGFTPAAAKAMTGHEPGA
jgi:hypothetical protein